MIKNDFLHNRKGEPVFLTGLQCHNSSSGTEMIDRTIKAIKLHGGNLLEAPVYWCETEPEEDVYDFCLVRSLVDKAKEAGLYLIPLWFGASKNGLFTYAPEYIKTNPGVYRLARNFAGIPVESLSPHCRATLERDKKAFEKVMEFLAEYDKEGTVIAVQVENEVGLVHTDRDYSEEAEIEFGQPVPEMLRGIVLEDSGSGEVCGQECSRREDSGKDAVVYGEAYSRREVSGKDTVCRAAGTGGTRGNDRLSWIGIFGRHANEAFCAWKHASYIKEMVEAGKEKFQIPYLMNVSIEINEYEAPALCYVSGGPVSRVLDIWKATAPGITLFGPDIYLPAERDYRKACRAYARPDNPLFIPETLNGGVGAAMNILIAAAEYGAIGICCFGAESGIAGDELLPEAKEMAISMNALSSLAPLLIKYRGTGRVHAVTQAEFSQWQYIKTEEYHITARFLSNDPKPQHYFGSRINVNAPENKACMTCRGRCLLIDCGEGEFYLAGAGVCFSFLRRPDPGDEIPYAHLTSQLSGQLNFLSIEEGHFEGGRWVCEYKRNGDEANYQLYVHEGAVVRVRLNQRSPFALEPPGDSAGFCERS